MRSFGVALVGFGYAGRVIHAPLIDACEGLHLRAVVSARPEAVQAARPGTAVVSFEAALDDPGTDVVVIATPNDTHAPLARRALAAGKAAVVDKPMALDLVEARELVDAARVAGRLLSVFQNRRWDADFLAVRALIAEGRLGRVARLESRFDRFRPVVRDRWRETGGPGSGVWADLGPHLIDQALVLFGPPQAVLCELAALRPGAAADDYAHAALIYPDRRVELHADMLTAASDLRFAVHGDRASFVKEGLDSQEASLQGGGRPGERDWGVDQRPGVLVDGADGSREPYVGPPGDWGRYYAALRAALSGEGPPPVSAEEGLAVMTILDAGWRTFREGRRVELAV